MAAPFRILIILSEDFDYENKIGFVWNDRWVIVEEAFQRLQSAFDRAKQARLKVRVTIQGHLGQNVDWEFTPSMSTNHATRKVFNGWYTQAVQAHAALIRQRVIAPSYKGES